MPMSVRIAALLVAVLGGGALLGGCPIPQPLPGVGSPDGGLPITPPRILTSSADPGLAMTDYGPRAACPPGSAFEISATLIDENAEEPVEVRWFVDYDPDNQVQRTPLQIETLPPPADPQQYRRFPSPFPFSPWDFNRPDERVHVVELTISNGFLPVGAPVPPGDLPNRTAAPGYEVQIFRWSFQPTATGGCGP
ncbi:MAG: hypothetical protein RJA59_625 [Pseudomonadota bacterium]